MPLLSRAPLIRHAVTTAAAAGVLVAAGGAAAPSAAAAARNLPPAVPGPLTTSPATTCQGQDILGTGDVTLYAKVTDPDDNSLTAGFRVTRHDTGAVVAETSTLPATAGTTAGFVLSRDLLLKAAAGGITQFDWKARAADALHKSGWSPTCHFSFDPTRPRLPVISAPGPTAVGTPVTVSVGAAATGDGVVPSRYQYMLSPDATVHGEVAADALGNATITFTPPRASISLTVTGLSAGGNPGGSATITIDSTPPPPPAIPAEEDLTGDGVSDLLVVGGRGSVPSGLWLAAGSNDGRIATVVNIGANGDGTGTGAASFDGATVLTGRFTDSGTQDVLSYHPATGAASLIAGNGTGAPLDPGSATHYALPPGTFRDANGHDPSQLVNAGHATGRFGPSDLLGISGSDADGYRLNLYAAGDTVGTYRAPVALDIATPDGTADWNEWTIASVQIPTDPGKNYPVLFLWKKSTGDLVLWNGISAEVDNSEVYADPYPIATGWHTGEDLDLHAADINGDRVPDLWTVGTDGTVTAHLITDVTAEGPATVRQVTGTFGTTG